MATEGSSAKHPDDGDAGDPVDRQKAELIWNYVDRLNAGETLDLENIALEHPEIAPELIRQLEAFRDLTAGPAQSTDAQPLGALGDYQLLRQLGRGGMGVVYEAWQVSMNRRVALKVLPAGISADTKAVTRFVREAHVAGKLQHPNVVPIFGMGIEATTPYFAMEMVDGETLAQVLARMKTAVQGEKTAFGFPRDDVAYFSIVARCFADAADGLQHAHSHRIIHRDVKPSNLILDSEGRLRILDFGLARLEGQESITVSGDCVGTPLYMSPEQARRQKIPVDHRTDIYSLGATLYEMLTLEPPFRGKDHADTLSQIIEREPLELRRVDSRVPRDLETIVLKCLRKDPVDRYGTAEALGQDLRRFVRGDAVEGRRQAALEKWLRRSWRQRLRLTALGATILLVLAIGVLTLNQRQSARERDHRRYRELVVRAVGSLELGGFAEPLVNRIAQRSAASIYSYLYLPEPGPHQDDSSMRRARGALQDLEEAIRLFPRRPDARYHLARGRWLLGRRDEALRLVDEALSLAPQFGPLRALKAAILAKEGKAEPARRELDEGRRLGGESWAEPWQRAQEEGIRGDWAAAADAFGDLFARERSGEESYTAAALELRLGRGRAYLQAGEFERARLDLAMAHERWPEALAPVYLIGRTFVLQGKRDLAAAWFREHHRLARREDPEVFRFILDLMNRDFETLTLWLEAMPPSAARDRVLACLLLEGGRTPQSLEVALQSIEKRPEDPVDLALLAVVKGCSQGGENEARALLTRIKEKVPINAAVCALASVACASFADHVERERWGRRLLELDPVSGLGLINVADSLQARGKPEEAVQVLEEARKRQPLSPGASNLLGFIHLFRRELDAAERELRRGLEVDPEEPFILSHLGLVQHGRRKIEEAESILRKALRLWPYYQRTPGFLAVLLEEQGRFAELPAVMLRALKDQNDHMGEFPRNVHGCLQDSLRWRLRFAPAPEFDDIAAALETSVAAGAYPPHFLQSLALVLLHAPKRKDLDRSLSLSREASSQRPGDPEALATLATVHAVRGERAEAIRTLEGAMGLTGEPLLQLADYRESYLPSLASCSSADWALESTRREVLIPEAAAWRYLMAASDEAPPGWMEAGFRDGAWSEGPSGFGYGGGDDATVLEPRPEQALFIRRPFTVAEPKRYRGLLLSLRIDGAYEVWLNGMEVASGVADACTGIRRKPHVHIEHRLEPRYLRDGENLLALRAQDAALWSRGLSLIPVLTAEVERDRAAELELRDRFAAAASDEEERRILAYVDARILDRDGKLEEAARIYRDLAGVERHHAEPHVRHVERLLAAGEAAQAEEHLRAMLGEGLNEPALWDLWARVAFRDLGWNAAELLDGLPPLESAHASDLRWLCERLEVDSAIRLNCGGGEHAAAGGITWGADRFFTSGGEARSNNDFVHVAGTDDQPLFKVCRSFPPLSEGLPGYRLPLPRGRYRVTLHFAEINFDYQAVGRRVFDVVVEGRTVLEGYDALARVGFGTAESLRFESVLVEDGRLEVEFVHRVRNPVVSGVEVERVE